MYTTGRLSEATRGGRNNPGTFVQAPSRDDEHDRRLGEAIDGCLEQLERGQPIAWDDWARRFPDVVDELRACLGALPLMPGVSQRRSSVLSAAGRDGQPVGALYTNPLGNRVGVTGSPGLRAYTLLEEIGRGGMGLVYRALQHATKRQVALKFLASGWHASPKARRRFAREVELAAALDHPCIVRVLEAGESSAGLYCAMELVDGDPLHVHLARHELSVTEKLRLFLQIVEGIHYAHLRAVIHRDLKPSNVMVDTTGCPRILDFGLARSAPKRDTGSEAACETADGQLVGTLPYFSPEQAAGTPDAVDLRSDLYALGVILYQMLTGRLPYETGGSLTAALHNICHTHPRKPSQFCRELNADIDAVVLKALEKVKENRYQTAAELAEDVRCCLRGEPAGANRNSRFYLLRKAYARHRTQVRLAAAGLSLVLGALGAILGLYVQVQQERDRLEEQLHVSVLERGLAHVAAGHDALAEKLLWSAYLDRPDAHAYWSLLSYYTQNPLLAQAGGGWVTCLAYSPDQRFLAYGNLNGTAGVCDATSLEALWLGEAHSGGISQLDFSPDGKQLATGGAEGRIKLWQVGTWEFLREFEAHRGAVTQLRFASRPDRLISAGDDGRVVLWRLAGTAQPRTVFADEGRRPITASALSCSGDLVAVATSANLLWIIEAETGERRMEPLRFAEPVEAVRFSPDGRTLAIWSRATVSLRDVATGACLWAGDAGLAEPRPASLWSLSPRPHVSWKPSLEFSSDGSLLVSAGWDAVVRLWRSDGGEALGQLRAHGTAVYAVAFQPDSQRLAAGYIGGIRIWDLDRHPAMLSRKLSGRLERSCVAVSGPAGLLAWGDILNGSPGGVSLMRTRPPRNVTTWRAHDTPVEAVAFDPDGRRLATTDREGTVAIWDVASHELLRAWRTGDSRVRAIAFSPDGARIACGNLDGELQVWDAADGSRVQAWSAHRGLILAVAFSPDGRRVASAGTDWRMKLWELGRSDPIGERQHHEWVNAVAFSPDGQHIATGSADLSIRIGRPTAPPEVEICGAHAHWVNAVAFLDHGRVVVSGGNDGAIRFWDTRTGQELAALSSLWGPIDTLVVTDDERFLAIGTARAVQLIDLGTAGDLIGRKALCCR